RERVLVARLADATQHRRLRDPALGDLVRLRRGVGGTAHAAHGSGRAPCGFGGVLRLLCGVLELVHESHEPPFRRLPRPGYRYCGAPMRPKLALATALVGLAVLAPAALAQDDPVDESPFGGQLPPPLERP